MSVVVGIIVSVATKFLFDRLAQPGIDELDFSDAMKAAISDAVTKTKENGLDSCFSDDRSSAFWEKDEVNEHLWGSLDNIGEPDYEKLWPLYSEIHENYPPVDEPTFQNTLEELWCHFLTNVEQSTLLSGLWKKRIFNQLDGVVHNAEARDMIVDYCVKMKETLEERINADFKPGGFDNDRYARGFLDKEFVEYRWTGLKLIEKHDEIFLKPILKRTHSRLLTGS